MANLTFYELFLFFFAYFFLRLKVNKPALKKIHEYEHVNHKDQQCTGMIIYHVIAILIRASLLHPAHNEYGQCIWVYDLPPPERKSLWIYNHCSDLQSHKMHNIYL